MKVSTFPQYSNGRTGSLSLFSWTNFPLYPFCTPDKYFFDRVRARSLLWSYASCDCSFLSKVLDWRTLLEIKIGPNISLASYQNASRHFTPSKVFSWGRSRWLSVKYSLKSQCIGQSFCRCTLIEIALSLCLRFLHVFQRRGCCKTKDYRWKFALLIERSVGICSTLFGLGHSW